MIAGWTNPAAPRAVGRKDPYEGLRWNPDREAFGPKVQPAPPDGPPRSPQGREWYTEFWDPTPGRSLDADYAYMCYLYFLTQREPTATYAVNNLVGWEALLAGILVGMGVQSGDPLQGSAGLPLKAAFVADMSNLRYLIDNRPNVKMGLMERTVKEKHAGYLGTVDQGPASLLYLALRAARRALAQNPDDAGTCMLLGRIYMELGRNTRDQPPRLTPKHLVYLRAAQLHAVLYQAAKLDPNLAQPHVLLSQVYHEYGFLDLQLDEMREARHINSILRARSVHPTEEFGIRFEQISEALEGFENYVKQREKDYLLASANQQPLQQAALALGQRDPKYWLDAVPGRNPPQRFGLIKKRWKPCSRSSPPSWPGTRGGNPPGCRHRPVRPAVSNWPAR